MKVKFYGTRGSIPVANQKSVKTGGNTTCLRVISECIPDGVWLVVDAGSGIVPMTGEALAAGVKQVELLFSHYHHDHTQGLPLSALTYIEAIPYQCWGPIDKGYGPKKVLQDLMKPPFFPVAFTKVASHFAYKEFEHPDTKIILVHPEGGFALTTVEHFKRAEKTEHKLHKVGPGKYLKEDCLVIRLAKTNHPDWTISYRFEEGPTGKVFTFVTDHENTVVLPDDLNRHMNGSDLLVMDAQYSKQRYHGKPSPGGFGHGTPGYCARTALSVGAKRLGLTHHDPTATDDAVISMLEEAHKELEDARKALPPATGKERRLGDSHEDVFACRDYLEVEV